MLACSVVYLLLGVVESVAAMTAYGVVLKSGGWQWGHQLSASDPLYLRSTTACLTAIVITQAANVFACRSETRQVFTRGRLPNRLLMAGVLIELLLIAGIDYTAWGHRVFGTATIGWRPWAVGGAIRRGAARARRSVEASARPRQPTPRGLIGVRESPPSISLCIIRSLGQ
jgi:magnesium-transporting ATPase (P-type)